MFDLIIEEVGNRFNLGDKALPLVQVLVAAMTNKETGGLEGFIERFKNNELSYLTDSWLRDVVPLNINHTQIEEVLGGKGGLLETITAKIGLDKGSVLMGLAYLLPTLFNKLAPNGKVADANNAVVGEFAQKGLALLAGVAAVPAPTLTPVPPPSLATTSQVQPTSAGSLLDTLVEEVRDHFGFGDKSLPLVQTVVGAMTNKATGGLMGFIDRFKKQGLGSLLDSWFEGSEPLNINHAEIEDVLGEKGGLLESIIHKIGLDKGSALMGLAYLLPKLFNILAPGGNVASAATTPAVSRFAEKGLALLGVGGAAAAASIGQPAAPAPVKPVPLNKPTVTAVPAVAEVAAETSYGGGIWKSLLWLLPILLGLLLLKTCAHTDGDSATNPVNSSTPTVAGAGSATPADASSVQVNPENTASMSVQPTPAAIVATPAVTAEPVAVATDNKAMEAPEGVSTGAGDKNAVPGDTGVSATVNTPAANEPSVASTPMPTTETATVNAAAPAEEKLSADVETLPSAKLYFKVGKIALPVDTKQRLAPVLKYLKAHSNAKVSVTGYHDPSGNAAANELLAKNRAKQVAGRLRAVGVSKDAIVLEKPQSTTGTGNYDEARRVEVTVIQ